MSGVLVEPDKSFTMWKARRGGTGVKKLARLKSEAGAWW